MAKWNMKSSQGKRAKNEKLHRTGRAMRGDFSLLHDEQKKKVQLKRFPCPPHHPDTLSSQPKRTAMNFADGENLSTKTMNEIILMEKLLSA